MILKSVLDGEIANYTLWHPQAVPGEDNNHDCMQLLSTLVYGNCFKILSNCPADLGFEIKQH